MAFVIHNPTATSTDNSGIGMILGVILALLAIVLLAIYGIPLLKHQTHPTSTSEITIPAQLPIPIPSSPNPELIPVSK